MTDDDAQTDPLEALLLEHIDILNQTFHRRVKAMDRTFYSYGDECLIVNSAMRTQANCRAAIETLRRVRRENDQDRS